MARQRLPPSRASVREIRVEVSGEEGSPPGGAPSAFTLGGRRHVVAAVVSTWRDESFSGRYRRDAWLGHRRLFYRVRTEAGELFDLYFDLGERQRRGQGRWVMHRRLAAGTTPEGGAGASQPPPPTEEQAAAETET